MTAPATVGDYLDGLTPERREVAEQVLEWCREAARAGGVEVTETISYQMPTIRRDGRSRAHFAVWDQHVSIYPVPTGDAALAGELAAYVAGKGTLKFSLREPLPEALIRRALQALIRG
ncbi:MAG: DUF1801 domain-containing protein [Nocardioides sp.]